MPLPRFPGVFKTVTVDNGSEFLNSRKIHGYRPANEMAILSEAPKYGWQ
jgi:hypothetical protein